GVALLEEHDRGVAGAQRGERPDADGLALEPQAVAGDRGELRPAQAVALVGVEHRGPRLVRTAHRRVPALSCALRRAGVGSLGRVGGLGLGAPARLLAALAAAVAALEALHATRGVDDLHLAGEEGVREGRDLDPGQRVLVAVGPGRGLARL